MHGGRWVPVARVGRLAALVGVVWVLSSGCLIQVLHLSPEHSDDLSYSHPCGRFVPQGDGEAILGVGGVTAPDITIRGGLLAFSPDGTTASGIVSQVWSSTDGSARSVGMVTAGTTYMIVVSTDPTATGYDTDVATFLVIRDAQGNQVGVDCVT